MTVGESGTLQANLRALEIADAINVIVGNAGLPELKLDPYSFPASQVQLEYFQKPTGICLSICQTRIVAMDSHLLVRLTFGSMKKATYQEMAAQYGLPTDETQIDANDIYMKIGAEAFAKVGHYLQMVDNKATALSVAYDPTNAMSEAAFYTALSIQQCQPVHSLTNCVRGLS